MLLLTGMVDSTKPIGITADGVTADSWPVGDTVEGNPADTATAEGTWEQATDTDTDTPSPPPDPPADTPDMSIPQAIMTRFPFCLPFDLYHSILGLTAPATVPVFDVPFMSWNIHIDLSFVNPVIPLVRWGLSLFFVIGLIILTNTLIRH